MLVRTTTVGTILLSWETATFGIDNQLSFREELISNLNGRLQIAACIATQVDNQIRETLLCQLGKGNQKLRICILAKVLHLDVTRFIVNHIARRNTLRGYLTTSDGNITNLILSITNDTQLHLCILRTLQTVHRFLVGTYLSYKGRVVDLYNLITSHHSCTLCRTITDNILDTDCILTDDELNANTKEGTSQVVVGDLPFTCRDIDRVGIEFCQNLWHSLLYEIIDIHCIDILVINNVQQIIQFVTTRIDDIQSVAREMVGIESTYKDTDDHT